jgi:hypothetical protein
VSEKKKRLVLKNPKILNGGNATSKGAGHGVTGISRAWPLYNLENKH